MYNVGDFIKEGDKLYQIKNIQGKFIHLVNVKTDKHLLYTRECLDLLISQEAVEHYLPDYVCNPDIDWGK